jgi:choline dehydrogenase-like flavoprotein
VFQGRVVGGSTVLNNGICLRVNQPGLTHPDAPDIFAKWAELGAPVDATRFDAAYRAIEQRLSVGPIDARAARNNGPHLQRGWAAHAAATGLPGDQAAPTPWFSKNYGPDSAGATCAYCGYCNTGCPYGRKQGMAQSFLLDARKSGAHILADTAATAIRWETPSISSAPGKAWSWRPARWRRAGSSRRAGSTAPAPASRSTSPARSSR